MSTLSPRRLIEKMEAELVQMREATTTNPVLEAIRADPAEILERAGMSPDGWQKQLLRSASDRILVLASRQVGKSQTSAALALTTALLDPSLVLLLSPTSRQSSELFRDKLLPLWRALDRPLFYHDPTQLSLELSNGSRIIALPGTEETIRCYSKVALLVIDEAARVPDALYYSVRPMLSISRGRLICVSSAYAKLGFFYEEYTGESRWDRYLIKATDCPRHDPEFLEEERETFGEVLFNQEYNCVFTEAEDAVFREEVIERMFVTDAKPFFPGA